MDDKQYLENSLEAIMAIPGKSVVSPHNIPAKTLIEEADVLHLWCLPDKEQLISRGLSWSLVEDLPARCGALREAQSRWVVEQREGNETIREWRKKFPEYKRLQNQLLKHFRYAFGSNPVILRQIQKIARGKKIAEIVGNLSELAVLGRLNIPALEAVGFDISLLDRADESSNEMGSLYASVVKRTKDESELKKIRNRAYTYLKQAMDQIRRCGKFVFHDNKERLAGYKSQHLRKQKMRGKLKKQQQDTNAELEGNN